MKCHQMLSIENKIADTFILPPSDIMVVMREKLKKERKFENDMIHEVKKDKLSTA